MQHIIASASLDNINAIDIEPNIVTNDSLHKYTDTLTSNLGLIGNVMQI